MTESTFVRQKTWSRVKRTLSIKADTLFNFLPGVMYHSDPLSITVHSVWNHCLHHCHYCHHCHHHHNYHHHHHHRHCHHHHHFNDGELPLLNNPFQSLDTALFADLLKSFVQRQLLSSRAQVKKLEKIN